MVRLSLPVEHLKAYYPVVVVGSGYGGAIAASRMARAGQQVCVLERGKEFQPGEYPDTELKAAQELQLDSQAGHAGSRTGLFNIHVNPDINVVAGCGLGGTSLINANVALRSEPRVFDDPRWPSDLRADRDTLLEESYRRAEEMLKVSSYPEEFPVLQKLQAMEKIASHLNAPFYRPPLHVNFKAGTNHVGIRQPACNLCGDCTSGCNYGAKNGTNMNYLPDARNHGAELFTEVEVRYLERKDDRWLVHLNSLQGGQEQSLVIAAGMVILGASSLGSTEILLRSRAYGMQVSDKLGQNFTGNGDIIGFAYNTESIINAVGTGRHAANTEPVGPCIAGIIDLRSQPTLEDGIIIEEGVIPSGLGSLLEFAFSQAALLVGKDTDSGFTDMLHEQGRAFQSLVRGPYTGAVRNTLTYLVMSHDDGNGRMELENDRLSIRWPKVGYQPNFSRVNEILLEATRALGGTYVKNPIWTRLLGHDVVTVHPLGGCCMAETAEHGVVNHKGQVFSGTNGTEIHQGLYVIDGAIVPRPIGINPLLTISALAERCCSLIIQDYGWQIDYSLPSAPITSI